MAVTLTSDQVNILNEMNRSAAKVGLGTKIDAIADVVDQSGLAVKSTNVATLAAAASQTIVATGAVAGDIVIVQGLSITATSTVSLVTAVAATDKVVIRHNAAPVAGDTVNVIVIKAVV